MLQKQTLNINFSQGLDTKTDPWQVAAGKFLSLTNSVFTKGGQLQKRNGYARLADLPATASYLTTFNGNLTAIGTSLQAYSSGNADWVNKGTITPVEVSALPLIRNTLNQSQCDAAVAANGLVCTVYTETNGTISSYKYAVADATTGQNIIAPTVLPSANQTYGTPRVYRLGVWFIILYATGANTLSYYAVNSVTPNLTSGPTTVSSAYSPSAQKAFDAGVYNNSLYIAFNGSASSGIKLVYLTQQLVLSSTTTVDASHTATIVRVAISESYPAIWVTYYSSSTNNAYTLATDPNKNLIFNPALVSSGTALSNITSAAPDGYNVVFYEVTNTYPYDTAIRTDYVQKKTATIGGGVSAATTVARSIGLASDAFSINGTIYFLAAYQSVNQSSYFLMDSSGNVVSRIAYQNGGGYLSGVLPGVSINGQAVSVPYLIKDLIAPVNKGTGVSSTTQQTQAVYSQTGINLATFTYQVKPYSVEIGSSLNLTGGFLSSYDGYSVTENNFFLYPENVEAKENNGGSYGSGWITTVNQYTFTVTALTSNLTPGDVYLNNGHTYSVLQSATIGATSIVTVGTGTPSASGTLTKVGGLGQTSITYSSVASTGTTSPIGTMAAKPDGLTNTNAYYYVVTYEWMDNQGNIIRSAPSIPIPVTTSGNTGNNNGAVVLQIPTLRLTSKTSNPVKICIYRWSVGQQTYYQTGLVALNAVTSPTINDPTVDYITVMDTLADQYILGNQILYTTGGVVENTSPPGFSSVFLYDDRLWGIDSEDRNTLYFSKQVIEATPVEMSDLFTYYVAPSLGAQGPSGNLTCGFPMDDKAILFKRASISYFNGTGPDNTGSQNGYSQPILITSTLGCSNQQSIVFMPNGLMFEFASEAGNQIWLLGRDLSTTYIGAAVEALTQNDTVQSAVNIPGSNQVRFTMASGITLMYDYFYQQWGTFKGIPAVSSTLYQGLHSYINSSGQVYQESPGSYLDGSQPVLMSFTTSWFNLAGIQGYQRAFFFYLLGKYLSPHKLQCAIAYDYNPAPTQTSLITPTNFAPTYGSPASNGQTTVYGQDTPYGGPGNVENWRVFLTTQRCSSFQITVDEIYDPSYGVTAGAGLTLTGLNLVVAGKKGFRPISAVNSIGG